MPRQSSILPGCQRDMFAARRMLFKDDNFIGQTLNALHLKKMHSDPL